MKNVITNIHRIKMPQLGPPGWEVSNVYFVGEEELVLIDAGYPTPESINCILDKWKELGSPSIKAILLTHAHPDHIGGIADIKRKTGAPIWAHREELEYIKEMFPLESVDNFIEEGDVIEVPGIKLKALHLPGHSTGHLCFFEESTSTLFTGDIIVNNSFAVIVPPRGNMNEYMNSLNRIEKMPVNTIMPGHGGQIEDPASKIKEYITHRKLREIQIIQQLKSGPKSIPDMAEEIYIDMHPILQQAGQIQLLAHLIKMEDDEQIEVISDTGSDSLYRSKIKNPPF